MEHRSYIIESGSTLVPEQANGEGGSGILPPVENGFLVDLLVSLPPATFYLPVVFDRILSDPESGYVLAAGLNTHGFIPPRDGRMLFTFYSNSTVPTGGSISWLLIQGPGSAVIQLGQQFNRGAVNAAQGQEFTALVPVSGTLGQPWSIIGIATAATAQVLTTCRFGGRYV